MRHILFVVVALGAFALLTRRRRTWHVFYILLGVTVLYTVLKLTGVIEAVAPMRNGVQ
jgi:hypothetical protein